MSTRNALFVAPFLLASLLGACATDAHDDADAAAVDADESAVSAASCLFGRTRGELETKAGLTLGAPRKLTKTTTLDAWETLQLSLAADGATTPAALFALVDGGAVTERTVTETASGRVFTYYRFAVGKKQRGVLFAQGTGARVARIDDDKVGQCAVTARAKASVCLFGTTRVELDAKTGLTFGKESTLSPTSSISGIRQQQLVLGIGDVATAKDAILATDDDVVRVRTITETKTGRKFTSYRTSRGDNPVGFVFAEGTLDRVVVDSDASLYECLVDGPCVPDDAATAYWKLDLEPEQVFRIAASEADGESYQDPQGRSVRWIAKTGETATEVRYTGGINDLWAQRFVVSKTTCGLTITGEH